MIVKFLLLTLIIVGLSDVQAQDSDCPKAIQNLANLADDDMLLRILIIKHEFRPFQKWPGRKDLLTPVERIKHKTRRSASSILEKAKVFEFYKIIIRIDNLKGMFDNENIAYIFRDEHQDAKIKKLVHVHSQEEKASLEIRSEEMNFNVEFHMGPKKKKINKVHDSFYSHDSKDKKKQAFLIDPDLEMGYGEPFTYQIFMYFKNEGEGNEPKIKADNDVNKAIKDIIKGSEAKPADGSFRWERNERMIRNVRNSLCKLLKNWITSSSSKTVKIDLYDAIQYVIRNPQIIFTQKPLEGENSGFVLSGLDFSRDKFITGQNSKSSPIMRELFDKHLKEFRNKTVPFVDEDGESDDLKFFDNINRQFRKQMMANFKEYRDAKNISGNFRRKVYHLDAIINHVQRTANETDANDVVHRTFHLDLPGSGCKKDCKKIQR